MTASRPASDTPRGSKPKQERGRQRVAAIMETAVEVFMEKGFDAATMTEIAARSGTAIGSLYRFFPSKESLADALLLRYALHVKSGLADIARQVPEMTLDGVADALVDFMLVLQTKLNFATTLLDARGGNTDQRARYRKEMRGDLAEILRKAVPELTAAKAKVMAVVLHHMLKGIAGMVGEEPTTRAMLLAEMREVIRSYLVSIDARTNDAAR